MTLEAVVDELHRHRVRDEATVAGCCVAMDDYVADNEDRRYVHEAVAASHVRAL